MDGVLQLVLLAASACLAVVPMVALLGVVWWLDRYTREPAWLFGLTFLWGGVGAVLLALLGNTSLEAVVSLVTRAADARSAQDLSWLPGVATPTLVAPLVEEPAKALVLLFVLWNRHLDNMNDGFVYGAAAGLGFGMTENFLYFAQTSHDPGVWMQTVILRTAWSALMHAMSCALVGAALAYGWFRGPLATAVSAAGGLTLAMAAHALWNGLLTAGPLVGLGDAGMQIDLLLLPLEIATVFLGFQVTLWQEGRTIQRELAEEVAAGRLPAGHPERIASWYARWFARDWLPPQVHPRRYLDTTTTLAIRKDQVRRMGRRAPAFYRDDVDRLRAQLTRMLARAPTDAAPPAR